MKAQIMMMLSLTSLLLSFENHNAVVLAASQDEQELSWYESNEYVPLAEECLINDPAFAEIANQAMDIMISSTSSTDDTSSSTRMSNLVSMIFDVFEDYCDEPQIDQFEDALTGFQRCSGIDLKVFVETFHDATFGAFINCGRYFYENDINLEELFFLFGTATNANDEDKKDAEDGSFPLLPPIPEQCMDAIVGNNPFGDMIRNSLEHPGLDTQCFSNLNKEMPSCTLKQWPMNLSGSVLKFASCVRGSDIMPVILKDSCEDHLRLVGDCLNDPIILEGRRQDKDTCDKWIQDCGRTSVLTMPSPLIGLPLSDICQDHLDFVQDGAKKLAAFQDSCVSEEDKVFWTRLEDKSTPFISRVAPLSSFEDEGRSEVSEKDSTSTTPDSRNIGSFFSGLISGMAIIACASLVFIARKGTGKEIVYSDLHTEISAVHEDHNHQNNMMA